jgi:glycine/D-amino acid oxidase-like deaminating enzyme
MTAPLNPIPGAVPSTDLRSLSFWWERLPAQTPREPLPGDLDADVAIIGAGFTGLWTAYYLLEHQPDLRVVLLEAEVAGFGASGRNGGWCSALFPATWDKMARASSRDGAIRLQQAMFDTVDEVGRVVTAENLDVDWQKGGSLYLARSPLQEQRAKEIIDEARAWTFGDDHFRHLDADEARKLVGASDVRSAVFAADCAVIQPAKLVRQLAEVVERRGATIYEHTPVVSFDRGFVQTVRGTVRADYIVRATEGYTATLEGHSRDVAPVYSLMIATEPLPDAVWDEIGLSTRPTFNDLRHLIIYGQRTADGRFAFGGRGAPYHFKSNIQRGFDRDPKVFQMLWHTLTELFPTVADYQATHHWGGPLGVTRDWWASAGLDASTGIAWSGGYVGDGVGTSNLGGRTVADLILRRRTDLVTLPWVDHRSRKWEPEPLRWLGVNTGLRAMAAADPEETKTGRPSVIAKTFNRLIHG